MTSTDTPLTDDEMRARIAELRPKYGLPIRAAYSALLQLYDALDTVAEAERVNNALMAQADEALGLSVMEGTGSEFFDVIAAIQRLAERHTNSDVSDDNVIPGGWHWSGSTSSSRARPAPSMAPTTSLADSTGTGRRTTPCPRSVR